MLTQVMNVDRFVQALPPIHRDPFDRLLVAQAQTEPLIC
jgi:PIN domain nuclease of toxin-antitoxin system